ncbi:hypothetical protein L0Y59_02045 [Candidatus Uhrbacteria bacterium]|nr:hypothetical protein [Candidatus Uhrbacteria bacterium]
MTRPHERLGLPQPIGRRLPQGVLGWNMVVAALTLMCVFGYVVQVNRAASRGYALRDVEKDVASLRSDVMRLEDTVAKLASVQALTERATALGFVPVRSIEYANPAAASMALR